MRKKICLSGVLLWSIHLMAPAQQAEVHFSATEVKADLRYLYHTLESAHYDLYAYTTKSTFDSAFQHMQQSLCSDSLSLLETVKLYQRFAALGNTGHCEIDFPVQSYITFARQGGALFPLELAFEEGKAYIRKNFSANPDIQTGAQLIRIDGRPVREIQSEIHPYLSAERPYFKDAKLELWSFPRLYWSVFGAKDTFTIEIRKHTGELETRVLEAIPLMEYESKRNGEILRSERFFKHHNQAAYIHPGPFSRLEGEEGEAAFRQFVDSAFADIRAKKSQYLIIDLRNNAGGHNAYSDYLIAYFADKPFRWYSSFRLKTSAVLKEHTRANTQETEMDAYAKAIMTHENGEIFGYDLPLQKPVQEDKRFSGKVYVLINRQTYSMAAVSAALMQDYQFATIVGEETADVPTLYASQFSFSLPKTGIVVKVPKGYIVRPNGSEALAGVVPDRVVRDHLLNGEDEILDYLLNSLQKPID